MQTTLTKSEVMDCVKDVAKRYIKQTVISYAIAVGVLGVLAIVAVAKEA